MLAARMVGSVRLAGLRPLVLQGETFEDVPAGVVSASGILSPEVLRRLVLPLQGLLQSSPLFLYTSGVPAHPPLLGIPP